MLIMLASALSFSPPPRCPKCGVGILPYGKNQPFAVDDEGRVYCREHGGEVEPDYPRRLEVYTTELRVKRLAAIGALEEQLERAQ